jgi:hypothetical protein
MSKGDRLGAAMTPGRATLAKLQTDDGLFEVNPGVPLGKAYRVDLDSRRAADFFNTKHKKAHRKTIINTISDDLHNPRVTGYLPLALLTLES